MCGFPDFGLYNGDEMRMICPSGQRGDNMAYLKKTGTDLIGFEEDGEEEAWRDEEDWGPIGGPRGLYYPRAWEHLAVAVAAQAAEDYRWARKLLRRNPRSRRGKRMAEQVEEFFRSPWFRHLYGRAGEEILRRLRKGE